MATDAGTVNMKMSRVMREVRLTVHLSGMQGFRCRMWLATQWFRLGAFIMGCQIRTVFREDEA